MGSGKSVGREQRGADGAVQGDVRDSDHDRHRNVPIRVRGRVESVDEEERGNGVGEEGRWWRHKGILVKGCGVFTFPKRCA